MLLPYSCQTQLHTRSQESPGDVIHTGSAFWGPREGRKNEWGEANGECPTEHAKGLEMYQALYPKNNEWQKPRIRKEKYLKVASVWWGFQVNLTSDKEKFTYAEKFSLHDTDFSTRTQHPKLGCPSSLLKVGFNWKNSVLFTKWETLIALPQSTLSVQSAVTT